jgi:hypothetical protein
MGVPGKHAVLYQAKENGINPFLRKEKGGRYGKEIRYLFGTDSAITVGLPGS